MFWREKRSLSAAPLSSKIALTAVLAVAGVGYLLGFLNIYLTYSPADGGPGMSVEDIRLAFYGDRDKSVLESAIDGRKRQYFASDADYQATKEWIAAGATEDGWIARIKPIFDVSCAACHSAEQRMAGVVTETYAGIQPYLSRDAGKTVGRLVSISHTHVLGTLTVVFVLVLIFSFTRYAEWLKGLIMTFAFLSILADVGAWWLAKIAAFAAPLVILGGVALAGSFALLIVLSFVDMWILPEEC